MGPPTQETDLEEAKERYILPNSIEEISRMFHQHEWVKASAGCLVKAPVNLNGRNFRILDSATADGFWINDARSIFPDDAEFVGFDIAPELYPPLGFRPPNVRLVVQDLLQPFDPSWDGAFDLVHQRFIFPSLGDNDMEQAVEHLVRCVKPGGWIQLVEPDAVARVSDPHAKAFDTLQRISEHVMVNPNPAPKIMRLLEKAKLCDICIESVDMAVGSAHQNREAGIRGRKNFGYVLRRYMEVSSPEDVNLSREQWESLPEDFERDLNEYKTAIRQNYIWARKPQVK